MLALAVLAAHALTTVYAYFSRDNHGWWWSDGHYNLLRAFYLANGLTLYSDIVSNHFPGFQVLYSIPLRLLGYGSAVPSNELLPTLEKVGMFIVMEFVAGEPLNRVLFREKRLSVRKAGEIVLQVAEALHYIHKQNVVHCDIKTENILIAEEQEEGKRSKMMSKQELYSESIMQVKPQIQCDLRLQFRSPR